MNRVVQYKVKADRGAGNESYVRAVYEKEIGSYGFFGE
jgi:hypothetical protein